MPVKGENVLNSSLLLWSGKAAVFNRLYRLAAHVTYGCVGGDCFTSIPGSGSGLGLKAVSVWLALYGSPGTVSNKSPVPFLCLCVCCLVVVSDIFVVRVVIGTLLADST